MNNAEAALLTRLMARRSALRKNRDGNGDSNSLDEDLQRRSRILMAIDEPATHREPFTDREDDQRLNQSHIFSPKNSTNNNNNHEQSLNSFWLNNDDERSIEKLSISENGQAAAYVTPFELSNLNILCKPSKNLPNDELSTIGNKMDDRSINNDSRLINDENNEGLISLKIREFELPSRMIAELRDLEIDKNLPILEKISHDVSESSMGSLTTAIEDLDVQIANLEMTNSQIPLKTRALIKKFETGATVENFNKIYPVLENIKFDSTGYTTKRKNSPSKVSRLREITRSREDRSRIVEVCENSGNCENFESDKILTSGENLFKNNAGNNEKFETQEITPPIQNESGRNDEGSKFISRVDKPKQHNDETSKERINSIYDDLPYHETPRASRKMPIMESTRKSLHSDSTKIKFPTPARVDLNSISNIEVCSTPETPSYKYGERLNETRTGERDFFNETIPYVVEHFLEDALGDELLNSTIMTYASYSKTRDLTNSHFTPSELISQERTPPIHRRIMQALMRSPMSEPGPRYPSTLDRSMQMCRSLSQRIKKKFRSGLKMQENESTVPTFIPSEAREADRVRELLREVNVQQTLMNQATKALNFCDTMKEFTESSERIESERVLLLANLRRTSMIEEIKRITSNENDNESNFGGQRGEIAIKNVCLNLRKSMRRKIEESEMIEWLVLIFSQGLRFWATSPISCQQNGDSKVSFPEIILMPDLTPSFKIHVEIYSMKIRKSTYSHEEKYRIDRKYNRSTSCPICPSILVSPTKLLKKVERPCLSPKHHYSHGVKNKNTSFVLEGFVDLYLHDLSRSSAWPLNMVQANSILQGTIDLSLACKLHFSVSHEGFVNHGDEAGGFAIWNRRWCVLKGHTLMFWNYPHEQETKEPLKIIDLINCVSRKITTADRSICAKPRTLLFETARPKKSDDIISSMIVECRTACTVVRNLISFDCVQELMEWSTKLNNVIMALHEWNVIHVNTEQVSDL